MKNGVKKGNYSIKTDLILGNYSVFFDAHIGELFRFPAVRCLSFAIR